MSTMAGKSASVASRIRKSTAPPSAAVRQQTARDGGGLTTKFSSAGRPRSRRTQGNRNGGRRLLQRLVRPLQLAEIGRLRQVPAARALGERQKHVEELLERPPRLVGQVEHRVPE